MAAFKFVFELVLFLSVLSLVSSVSLPIVLNTWPFTNATSAAWLKISEGGSAVDAVEAGCSECEEQRCDGTVGWGGDPDEAGETTLDAMIMDGITHDVGGVGALRRVKNAISVARAVMERTDHTLLAGDLATQFAVEMGFKEEDLHSNISVQMFKDWKSKNCQPNFRKNVVPDPSNSCGPYKPASMGSLKNGREATHDIQKGIGYHNHDTIGMLVIDKDGNIAGGTTTNGVNHKIPGRVGDSPIAGAGAYVDNEVGGAAATGDGDVMMRFLPSFYAVSLMRTGVTPGVATAQAITSIVRYYPGFIGAVIAARTNGEYGAACYGIRTFHYSVRNADSPVVTVKEVNCLS